MSPLTTPGAEDDAPLQRVVIELEKLEKREKRLLQQTGIGQIMFQVALAVVPALVSWLLGILGTYEVLALLLCIGIITVIAVLFTTLRSIRNND